GQLPPEPSWRRLATEGRPPACNREGAMSGPVPPRPVPLTSFADRVAVITGAGSGIGRALALALARERARVVLADVDEAGMAETDHAVRAHGGSVLVVRTDVTELAQVEALADRAFQRFGAVHLLCNNAGVALSGGLEHATRHDWQWAIGVNLWGVIHGLLAF